MPNEMLVRSRSLPAATYTAMHSAPLAVEVRGLTKRFPVRRGWKDTLRSPWRRDTATVVRDVSFNVAVGEFYALLGPNGAGKTTIFRMLAAAMTPDAGSATVLGQDVVRNDDEIRRLVGAVLVNERSLYWRLSAVENLRVYGALYGLRDAAAAQRIGDVLRLVGLHDTGDKMVATFSSGMRQRLLIARALLPRPRVLLLDEPTRSLDPISARDFRSFLRTDVARNGECTVLLATHSSEEAFELCDRAAVLDKGRLRAAGTPDELRERFGGHRYTIWTTQPEHEVFETLVAQGLASNVSAPEPGEDGWSRVALTIRGDIAAAALVLGILGGAGVRVGRFERLNLSLADLLERVVTAAKDE